MNSTDKIAEMLAGLSATERAELSNQLAYSGVATRKSANAKRTFDENETMCWEALCAASKNMGLTLPGPSEEHISNLDRRKITREQFAECATALSDYVKHACSGGRLDRTHKLAVYVEVLSCLIRSMQSRYRPEHITVKAMINEIGVLPQAVNRCYPFYA